MGINKRGNIYSAVMISIILFMIGMICMNFIKPEVTTARTSLSCSSANTISDGTKLMCLAIDTVVPYLFILIIAITGGVITEKLLI
jgi:hypothetical protein